MTIAATRATGVIRNPILPGFHPDPSLLRVGADYYLATSTFEWYPGVRVHHSRDLVHWRALGGILTERRLLDLSGAADSGGVWAPDLSYVDGRFHLVYTDVSSFSGGYWDAQNYLVTAEDIAGPWSDPIPLHAFGFDASLFHDDDGSSWLLWMNADWRPGRDSFGGIGMQRYDRAAGRLVGEPQIIFTGTATGMTEGPHVYRHDGWYYLVTAEGGTSWDHQVTVARSRRLAGPYTADPTGPLLTSRGRPDLTLQKAGHGSLVQTQAGQWYLAHLVARPYRPLGPCVLGRETAIQAVSWTADGWPRVADGLPAETVPAPDLPAHPWPAPEETDEFTGPALDPAWSTLRRPADPGWVSLTDRPGHLRVYGGQSPVGRLRPSLVARRLTAQRAELSAVLSADPASYRQLAGITGYYNSSNWHYAYLTRDDEGRRVLEVLSSDSGRHQTYPEATVDVGDAAWIGLRVRFDGPVLRFAYDLGGGWRDLGLALDATILSDEHAARFEQGQPEAWGFTGAFAGLWVQDLGATGGYADFARATYRDLD